MPTFGSYKSGLWPEAARPLMGLQDWKRKWDIKAAWYGRLLVVLAPRRSAGSFHDLDGSAQLCQTGVRCNGSAQEVEMSRGLVSQDSEALLGSEIPSAPKVEVDLEHFFEQPVSPVISFSVALLHATEHLI